MHKNILLYIGIAIVIWFIWGQYDGMYGRGKLPVINSSKQPLEGTKTL